MATDPNISNLNPAGVKNKSLKVRLSYFSVIFMENFAKFVPVNFMYSILSVLLLPAGLAAAGITNVTRNVFSGKHTFGLSDFFETIKNNWRQALPVGVLNLIIWVLLIVDAYFFYMANGTLFTLGLGVAVFMIVLFAMMNFYIWPLIVTMNFTLKQIYSNSLHLVFVALKENVICLLLNGVVVALLVSVLFVAGEWFILVAVIELLLGAVLLPCFHWLLTQCFAFPVITEYIIEPYYREHPDADRSIINDLGIFLTEEE